MFGIDSCNNIKNMTSYSIDYENRRFSKNQRSKIVESFITNTIACLGPIVIPPLHIYIIYHFWRQYSRHVDRHYCTCSCWDTVFKGTYESGIASYKHVYFNATRNTGKIWSLTALCVIALYEAVRRLAVLLLNNRLRHSMLILFLSSIFSHYYSWWSFFNYWNDDFYSQWNHQLFFSLTELFSTLIVLRLADSRESVRPFKVLPIVAVAATHIVASSWDQFLDNVIRGEGSAHQVLRDVCFMVPDILHVVLPLLELLCVCSHSHSLRRDCLLFCILLTIGLVFSIYTNSVNDW
uniref:Uncharacterized protein n=2 Tax=Homalodisca liturata TaxID=320908 RepID=A0A1B6J3J9_9HEMI